jgi:glucose-1-phosphate thymidylyltransferase
VSEYLVQRMILGGADKICFVIGPGKSDIMSYFGARYGSAEIAYVVQPGAEGLCDAIFRASCVVGDREPVLVGLPDTIWFPEHALSLLPDDDLSFLLFPVDQPQFFDAVLMDGDSVTEIKVKQPDPGSHWIWGAFRLSAQGFQHLRALWNERDRADEYIGTLVNAYLANGGLATGIKAGHSYVDVGTLNGYRAAIALLGARHEQGQHLLEVTP